MSSRVEDEKNALSQKILCNIQSKLLDALNDEGLLKVEKYLDYFGEYVKIYQDMNGVILPDVLEDD